MFPGPGARIYRNEVGEVIGWDYPPDEDDLYDPDDWLAANWDEPDSEDDPAEGDSGPV